MMEAMMMTTPSDPSAIRICSRKRGRIVFAMITTIRRKMTVPTNTPRIKVFSFPNSRLIESRDISLRNVFAKAAIGITRKLANCVRGITAPSSTGFMYFGTSHKPTIAFMKSAVRQAQKIISEYHQKSPSFACNFVNIFSVGAAHLNVQIML